MTSSADVIVQAESGGRPLLRTADSLLRQRLAPASVALIKSAEFPAAPLVKSAADRLSAIVLDGSPYPGVSLNAALRSGEGQYFVVLQAGLTLEEGFLECCDTTFAEDDGLSAIAPAIALRAPDGTGELLWTPDVHSVVSILSNTRSVPPAFAIQRKSWNSLAGFDERLDDLVEYAFWLRLIGDGHRVRTLSHPFIARELGDRSTASAEDDGRRLRSLRAVLDRHASILDREMVPLLVSREVRFGRLREIHRELLAERDRDLAELDRIRAGATHHLAYLKHHGSDRFDWGDFRRTDPVSRDWGYDRGTPIDRRFIDDFMFAHSSDVHGAVLEIQEDDFTLACGGRRVIEHSVLDIDPLNPRATVVADLRLAPELASEAFDCIILTQTLHVIDDMRAALAECYRILKPGGVLLATLPSASRVCLEYGQPGDYWRMTPAGARALFTSAFAPAHVSCDAFGNVLTNTAFLHGLSTGEVADAEFDQRDPYFPVLTGVRAKKAPGPTRPNARGLDRLKLVQVSQVSPVKTAPALAGRYQECDPARRSLDGLGRSLARGVVLLYHRVDDVADAHGLGVPPAIFESHLKWLRSECQIVELEDLLSRPPEQLPPRAVALTFDDGYEDNLRAAVPLLQEQGAPATFFLTTRWLEEYGEYWWDTLERVLLSRASMPAALDLSRAGLALNLPTNTVVERRITHRRLHELLVHAPLEQRECAVQMLREWSGGGKVRTRPMVADEVRHLASLPGATIGAHSVNHLSLPDHPNSRLLELTDSQGSLRRVTGQAVEVFAYPYGAIDRETLAVVRRLCRWGVSCDDRVLGESFDAARVPRLDVKSWPWAEFAVRVSRLFEPALPSRRPAVTLVP